MRTKPKVISDDGIVVPSVFVPTSYVSMKPTTAENSALTTRARYGSTETQQQQQVEALYNVYDIDSLLQLLPSHVIGRHHVTGVEVLHDGLRVVRQKTTAAADHKTIDVHCSCSSN